ncbi:MAG: hypothetical protein LUQ47_06105 [Methanotrichaceae archaeon]|nr:hypothetical protein [Methanotrichaceae archaeon]
MAALKIAGADVPRPSNQALRRRDHPTSQLVPKLREITYGAIIQLINTSFGFSARKPLIKPC